MSVSTAQKKILDCINGVVEEEVQRRLEAISSAMQEHFRPADATRLGPVKAKPSSSVKSAPRKAAAPKNPEKRKGPDMRCRHEKNGVRCKNRSRGPRYSFKCKDHGK